MSMSNKFNQIDETPLRFTIVCIIVYYLIVFLLLCVLLWNLPFAAENIKSLRLDFQLRAMWKIYISIDTIKMVLLILLC